MDIKNLYEIEKLDDLIRHISKVRESGILLGRRLINRGIENNSSSDISIGHQLIARVHIHDNSKFYGMEWKYMGKNEQNGEMLKEAILHHQSVNDHHPEYWRDVNKDMPAIAIAEMICDWKARSEEFGTSLKDYIKDTALNRFNIPPTGRVSKIIKDYVDLLLDDDFSKKKKKSSKNKETSDENISDNRPS